MVFCAAGFFLNSVSSILFCSALLKHYPCALLLSAVAEGDKAKRDGQARIRVMMNVMLKFLKEKGWIIQSKELSTKGSIDDMLMNSHGRIAKVVAFLGLIFFPFAHYLAHLYSERDFSDYAVLSQITRLLDVPQQDQPGSIQEGHPAVSGHMHLVSKEMRRGER